MKVFGLKMDSPVSLAVGAGVVILAPVIASALAGIMKPLAKSAIKGGLLAYEKTKIAMAETKETFEDIAAEARSEIAESKNAKAAAE